MRVPPRPEKLSDRPLPAAGRCGRAPARRRPLKI